MTRILNWTLAPAIIVASLSGCAHAPAIQDELSFPERQVYLEQLEGWNLSGRIAVDTGEQAFQGRFRWQQSPESLDLSIRGPFGAGVLEVAGPPERLTVRARGESWALTDPEAELSELMGWWLPVRSFSAWLLGLPVPLYPATTALGPENALQSLEQRLWKLTYQTYQLTDGVLLPRRIDLSHQDLELRLIIDQWESVDVD